MGKQVEHYKMAIQPIQFIQKNELPFSEGNVIKYVCRHRRKNGLDDLLKAKNYIDYIIAEEYPNQYRALKEHEVLNVNYIKYFIQSLQGNFPLEALSINYMWLEAFAFHNAKYTDKKLTPLRKESYFRLLHIIAKENSKMFKEAGGNFEMFS